MTATAPEPGTPEPGSSGPGTSGPGTPELGPLEVPPPTMTPRLAATSLVLEAFVVFFATLVASRLLVVDGPYTIGQVLIAGGVLTVLFLLASGVVRRPGGIVVGTALQVLLIATGVFVPAMFVVGGVFAVMWFWLVWIGRKVDGDRRRWAADLAAGGTGRR